MSWYMTCYTTWHVMSFHFSWSIVYIIFKIYFSFSLLENLFITFWGQKMRRFGKNRVMICHFMSCHVMSWLLKLCWGSIFFPVFIMPQKIFNFILFFKKISKFGQNHVMSCHVMSCHGSWSIVEDQFLLQLVLCLIRALIPRCFKRKTQN